ncbi:MAG: alpha-glucan family phosphorylase [Dehalococcoidia bacterium]|nr:alpha-glucan family phosphorylase [Dehalococcoidia bacterium]
MTPSERRKLPERIKRLDELATNLWWAWHPKARDVFRMLDYPLWRESGHNPVQEVYNTPDSKLEAATQDVAFLSLYDSVMEAFDADMTAKDTWVSANYPELASGPIAYFSMEFALHNSLPIYAGGLGVLAGDICKEASDLGLPFVGIGFMYPQGYFHQHIAADGWQQEIYRQLNFEEAPISRLNPPKGISVAQVQIEDRTVSIAVWLVKAGRVNIYLLDTNLEQNTAQDRVLSARLYTADPEVRMQQEIVLGIGGVRVLRALGIHPAIWHANEGHSTFMVLERIREEVGRGVPFNEALSRVRANTVFTTHTPVACAHDCFLTNLVDKYFSRYWESIGIDRETFLEIGRPDVEGRAGFNMTALGLNASNQRNAVSKLHGGVTRRMWAGLWPNLPEDKIPITYVTNGIHVPTWIAAEIQRVFEKYLGHDCLEGQHDPAIWKKILDIPDNEVWEVRQNLKVKLLNFMLDRAQRRWAEGDVTAQQVVTMGALLHPDALTIGFARRFTEYKRPTLLFQDMARLKKILNNPFKPVQLIFAGKSHPADWAGKQLLHQIYAIAQDREFQGRVAFIEDYDMHTASYMTHGVDVWLNTPRRLQEACGTSGMKAAINGVPHLSVRDGWWYEGYNGSNGWAIGPGPEAAFSDRQDEVDAQSLYRILEEEVIPLYYDRDRAGFPHGWIRVVKESILSSVTLFSACRMMMDYTEKMYREIPQSIRSKT